MWSFGKKSTGSKASANHAKTIDEIKVALKAVSDHLRRFLSLMPEERGWYSARGIPNEHSAILNSAQKQLEGVIGRLNTLKGVTRLEGIFLGYETKFERICRSESDFLGFITELSGVKTEIGIVINELSALLEEDKLLRNMPKDEKRHRKYMEFRTEVQKIVLELESYFYKS